MLLNTFRKSGAGVATPVWTVPVSDGRVGMWTGAGTGKYQRLRNNPHVTIQACTPGGNQAGRLGPRRCRRPPSTGSRRSSILNPEPVAQQRGNAAGFLKFFGPGCLPPLSRLTLIGLSGLSFGCRGGPSWSAWMRLGAPAPDGLDRHIPSIPAPHGPRNRPNGGHHTTVECARQARRFGWSEE